MFNYVSEDVSYTAYELTRREKEYKEVYDAMEVGKKYRCKDIPVPVKTMTPAFIGHAMKHLMAHGLVIRIEEQGEPIDVSGWCRDKIVVCGEVYYSKKRSYYERKIIPTVRYYVRVK